MARERIDQAWREHRPYLVNLAFRMLGDVGTAEDVVQEAFARLSQATFDEIQDARGWLVVVTSRLCLDHLRSARSRWETTLDPGDIETVPGIPAPWSDPADRITLDDSVRLALLVVLHRLGPAERVVFVLHDIFGLPFDSVADTVGRPVATCRQLARRARRKIEDSQADPRFEVGAAHHRLVTERFITACMNGELTGLLAVLDPDADGEVDLGSDTTRRPGIVRGARHVARNLVRHWGSGVTLVRCDPLGGAPAILGFVGHRLVGVLLLTVRDGLIHKVHVIADPGKLAFLTTQGAHP